MMHDTTAFDYAARLARLREGMRTRGFEGIYLTAGPNMRYFTGWSAYPGGWPIWCSAAILPAEGDVTMVLSTMHADLMREARTSVSDVRTYDDGEDPTRLVRDALRDSRLAGGRLGVEDQMWFGDTQLLRDAAPDAELASAGDLLDYLRSIKDAQEIEIYRRATEIGDIGYQAAYDSARPGKRYYEVARDIIDAMIAEGAETMQLAGDFRSLRTDALAPGTVMDIDLAWTRYRGYHMDSARNLFLSPVDDEHRRIYDIVVEAYLETLPLVRPGTPIEDVHRRSEEVLAANGLKQPWKIGHGMGLSMRHEPPMLQPGNADPLEPGMVCVIDPGTFVFAGDTAIPLHIESVLLITDDGSEELTKFRYDLLQVG